MENEPTSRIETPSWQAALDPGLTRRLLRPIVRPGVISPRLGRSILARMQGTGTPLPLLDRMFRSMQLVEDQQTARRPFVYARPASPADQSSRAEPGGAVMDVPVVQAGPVRSPTNPGVPFGPTPPAAARPIVQAQAPDVRANPVPAQPAGPNLVFAQPATEPEATGVRPNPVPAQPAEPNPVPAQPAGPHPVPAQPAGPHPVPAQPAGPNPVPAQPAVEPGNTDESGVRPNRFVLPAGRRQRRGEEPNAAPALQRGLAAGPVPTDGGQTILQRAPAVPGTSPPVEQPTLPTVHASAPPIADVPAPAQPVATTGETSTVTAVTAIPGTFTGAPLPVVRAAPPGALPIRRQASNLPATDASVPAGRQPSRAAPDALLANVARMVAPASAPAGESASRAQPTVTPPAAAPPVEGGESSRAAEAGMPVGELSPRPVVTEVHRVTEPVARPVVRARATDEPPGIPGRSDVVQRSSEGLATPGRPVVTPGSADAPDPQASLMLARQPALHPAGTPPAPISTAPPMIARVIEGEVSGYAPLPRESGADARPAAPAVDLNDLVDRALRKLLRRLDIESERKGRGPWGSRS